MKRILLIVLLCTGCGEFVWWSSNGDSDEPPPSEPPSVPYTQTEPPEDDCPECEPATEFALVAQFEMAGDTEEPCCVDIDLDGTFENSLGENLEDLEARAVTNAELQSRIDAGDWTPQVALIPESATLGWTDNLTERGDELGLWGVDVDEESITAQGGRVNVPVPLWVPLFAEPDFAGEPDPIAFLPGHVTGLQLHAEGAVQTGVLSGTLGVVIELSEWVHEVNRRVESCACLDLHSEPLMQVDNMMCSAAADTEGCRELGDIACAEFAESCGAFQSIAVLADIDLDGDGLNDAVSVGYVLRTQPTDR